MASFYLKSRLRNSHIVVCILLTSLTMSAQFKYKTKWHKIRHEFVVGVGISGFLGDLGGLNKVGAKHSPADLDLALTQPALAIGYRYKILKNLNSYTSLSYLKVAGDDKLTTEPFRNNRNLSFKSNIFELSTRAELSFFTGHSVHHYKIKSAAKSSVRMWEFIGFVGIGCFYYNPKALNPATGQYTALRPLHTEGQGLPGGPKQYGNFAVAIPMGVAFRMIMRNKWSIGLEVNYRKTFTDYIDDVSTVYYNKYELENAYGSTSVVMADPSKGIIPGATAPDASGQGAKRGGNKGKDSYMTLQLTVSYFIKSKTKKSMSKF